MNEKQFKRMKSSDKHNLIEGIRSTNHKCMAESGFVSYHTEHKPYDIGQPSEKVKEMIMKARAERESKREDN